MKKTFDSITFAFRYVVPIIILFSISLAIDSHLVPLGNVPDYLFYIVVPVLTASIAHYYHKWILSVPALALGFLIQPIGIGFFGGIFGGLILSYVYDYMKETLFRDEQNHRLDIKGIVTIVLSAAMTYVLLKYVIGPPIIYGLDFVTNFVANINTSETIMIVLVLAFLNSIDLGGPFNKVAFGFAVQFYSDGFYNITGPVMVSVVVPPMTLLVALLVFQKQFTRADQKNKKWLGIGSVFGLTETSLPLALQKPHVYIPILMIGAMAGSTAAVLFGIENELLIVSLPGILGVNYKLLYLLAHGIGVAVSTSILWLYFTVKPHTKQT